MPLRISSFSIRQFFLLLSCASLGLTATPGNAQQQRTPSSAGIPTPSPVLRVTTRLVQVNVVVNDKHGNPITGLAEKDFSILDNGKSQKIELFSAETNLPTALSFSSLPPGTYTNRPEELTNLPSSVTVILLDGLNTEASDQTLARRQVLRALQEIRPQDYVALYWLGNNLQILHDFTIDASALRQVLAGYDSKTTRELNNSQLADPSLNSPNPSTPAGQASERQAFRLAFDQRVANQSTHDRVRATVAALIAISNHLGTRKGRKSLVWVSSSFPVSLGYDKFDLNWINDTGEDFTSDIHKAAQALTSADIAVYPVDARGLLGSNVNANNDDLDSHIGDPNDTDTHLPSRAPPGTFDTMRILAERTGGKAFYDTNDLSGAIRRAMNDSRATYVLSYSPASVRWDGSFHEIKVKVAAPGAQVRARSGYFAIPDAPTITDKNDHSSIVQLATSRLPATGIGLHVRAQVSGNSDERILIAELHLDLREINMQRKENHWAGTLQSIFLQLDSLGRVLKVDDRTFHPDFDSSAYELGLRKGITDTRQIRVLPNADQLCIVVRDPAGSRVGSIYVPLAQYFSGSSKPADKK
ncbi:MAG TPA: VWA domain-containing protein [Candidatus Dormibacteraeota bacterium]|jgi:VWFA-related protein|nr:VWA domain-containing protein [Candidatus Dormibacteraeota bacterium]